MKAFLIKTALTVEPAGIDIAPTNLDDNIKEILECQRHYVAKIFKVEDKFFRVFYVYESDPDKYVFYNNNLKATLIFRDCDVFFKDYPFDEIKGNVLIESLDGKFDIFNDDIQAYLMKNLKKKALFFSGKNKNSAIFYRQN